jgi:transcriptional regulator with XRE-family HTH domain
MLASMKKPPVTVSSRLRAAVWAKRAEGIKVHQLAAACGLHPSTFSQIVCDLVPLQPDDQRVLKIAAAVGVPATEAFQTKSGRR